VKFVSLCKICDLPDWDDTEFLALLDELRLSFGREDKHRKHWEFVQTLRGLRQLDCLTPEAVALGVAAGHEHPIYYLANTVRSVVATDIYGRGDFAAAEAPAEMLTHPEQFAPFPYRQDHLVVEYMDALELNYPDNSFDIVFSLSSVEHFGGHSAAGRAVQGMARLLRPGGILVLTTEAILNHVSHPDFFLPEELAAFLVLPSGLTLVDEIDFTITPSLMEHPLDLNTDLSGAFPHIVLKDDLTIFTSVILFLRKPANGWALRDLPGVVPEPADTPRRGWRDLIQRAVRRSK
jgi:SAM-dependent methyltransferase